jgi:hypothetical protein
LPKSKDSSSMQLVEMAPNHHPRKKLSLPSGG